MKWSIVLLLASSLIFISETFAQDSIEIPDDIDLDDDEENDSILRQMEEQIRQDDLRKINKKAQDVFNKMQMTEQTDDVTILKDVDPCSKFHCSAGMVCQSDIMNKTAACVCIPECPEEIDPRRKVCTNRNVTWGSDCEVHRQRCLCDTNEPTCIDKNHKHIHIDYYGECKQQPECTSEEKLDFPRRVREWLFNVMRDLAERQELGAHYIEMKNEAVTNLTRRWTNAAIWKWCDLDGHPKDNQVSRHELFPIRAPLMALEHCISPFLKECDVNDDHLISLPEWGKCLGLEDDDLVERCDKLVNPNIKNNDESTNQV